MKVVHLLPLLLLMAASGLNAQTLPGDVQTVPERPLNLSVRTYLPPVTDEKSAPVSEVLPTGTAQPGASVDPSTLPYGAGFESRQRGAASGSGGSGKGSGGGAGNGGGGRGGSGRGR